MKRKKSSKCKTEPKFTFIDVELCFASDSVSHREEIKDEMFEGAIKLALKSLHGEVGKAIPFQILYYDTSLRRAYIQLATKNRMKFWSALTLFSSFLQMECLFRVHQVENTLANLKINSNTVRNLVQQNAISD